MEDNKFPKALKEVYIVLQNSEKDIRDKIPENFNNFIIEKMDKEYNPIIEFNDNNWEATVSEETRAIIGLIYRDYLVSKEEREKLLKEESEIEKKIEQELRKKYSPDDLFKNKAQNKQDSNDNRIENTKLIKNNETIFRKIINSIRGFFGRKKY